jgi:hypothetical protein
MDGEQIAATIDMIVASHTLWMGHVVNLTLWSLRMWGAELS